MSQAEQFTQDEVRAFVLPCHGNLAVVEEMVAASPALVNTYFEAWNETPLGAAAHVGNRPVAEFLLAHGAKMEICAAAMLGHREDVLAQMDADPSLANTTGAHGIPIMYHIALSGDVAFADEVVARGGGGGIDRCLHAAVGKGHKEMVSWLLAKGAALDLTDFRDKTPLELAEELNHTEIAALLKEASKE